MLRPFLVAGSICVSGPAMAEVPHVVTDIAPVHSLVAQVMAGVGVPELIVRPGVSPHTYAMRPSEARALQEADLVVWIGSDLTPWLSKPLQALASGSRQVALLEQEATQTLPYREFDHEDGHEEEGHDAHDDDGHDGHDHEGVDPHAWLDPQNARAWLGVLADELADLDPEHAGLYRENAVAAQHRLDEVSAAVAAAVSPMREVPFVALHDAFQYFEHRHGLTLVGTVSLGDASRPSPARLAELREDVEAMGVTCAFAEPQFDTALLEAAVEGSGARILVLDPLGAQLEPGPELYKDLLTTLAAGFGACADN